jgi:hypothetical protein
MRHYKRVIGNASESHNDTFKSLDCMGDLGELFAPVSHN